MFLCEKNIAVNVKNVVLLKILIVCYHLSIIRYVVVIDTLCAAFLPLKTSHRSHRSRMCGKRLPQKSCAWEAPPTGVVCVGSASHRKCMRGKAPPTGSACVECVSHRRYVRGSFLPQEVRAWEFPPTGSARVGVSSHRKRARGSFLPPEARAWEVRCY